MQNLSFPKCLKCNEGVLIPLSDYGRGGATIHFKAWVCNNPSCHFQIRIDNGEVSVLDTIASKKRLK